MFTPEQRRIFRYHDGAEERFGDPLAIRRRYWRALKGHDEEELLRLAEQPLELSDEALDQLLGVIRAAFEVQPLDPATGAGLTENEALALLSRFFRWEADLGEAGGASPTSSPPTDSPPVPEAS